MRQLYERQQRDFAVLQLNFETTKQLLTEQQMSLATRDWSVQLIISSQLGWLQFAVRFVDFTKNVVNFYYAANFTTFISFSAVVVIVVLVLYILFL